MYRGKSFLAVILARSGSKRLPDKNIKNLCGKPLLAWSIQAGLQSRYIDELTISTDSAQYAQIAKDHGAQAPFLRPSELSLDTSSSFDSLKHTIDFYQTKQNREFDYIFLLQPTSPLRDGALIDGICEWIVDNDYQTGVSVSECEHPPLWSNTLPEDRSMKDFFPKEVLGKRSQELPTYYRINGVLYVAKIPHFLQHEGFITPDTIAYEIPQHYAIDIDTALDFEFAEFMMRKYHA